MPWSLIPVLAVAVASSVASAAIPSTAPRAAEPSVGMGDVCAPGWAKDGSPVLPDPGCSVDGTGCSGADVTLQPLTLDFNDWDAKAKKSSFSGNVTSYYILGKNETWEMYLHGPAFHLKERSSLLSIPDVYVFGTFSNQIYRFENISLPANQAKGEPVRPLKATQKMVGTALAPSTGYLVQDTEQAIRGMFIAEGQPFWMSNLSRPGQTKELYKGGVQYLHDGHTRNCSSIFPLPGDLLHDMTGQVVNTVDCHHATETCFFSVWKFYDDTPVVWTPESELLANDCLYYCQLEKGSLTPRADGLQTVKPRCVKGGIVYDENRQPICHKHKIGAVHGLKVGNTDPADPTKFDLLLVFTGIMLMSNGESSMRKLSIQITPDGSKTSGNFKVTKSTPFALDLFGHPGYAPTGFDVGGDHAWVDETGKYVWVSCFREKGLGLHMLDYETGELLHSITGIDRYVADQYTYTAGIHGVGTLGKPGSYIAVATSSCHDIKMCIPTIPWEWPIPAKWWSNAPFIIVDISHVAKPKAKLQSHSK